METVINPRAENPNNPNPPLPDKLRSSRDFHLAHRDLSILMGSWVVVVGNGTTYQSTGTYPTGLGAMPHHFTRSSIMLP